MPVRKASAEWKGTLREGAGTVTVGSGVFEGPYTHASRFADAPGTNPEELIGAAHAGCFSMFLASLLTNAGLKPVRIHTEAQVRLETAADGPTITEIELATEAEVAGLDEAAFLRIANEAKEKCPVSKALAGPEIKLTARLIT